MKKKNKDHTNIHPFKNIHKKYDFFAEAKFEKKRKNAHKTSMDRPLKDSNLISRFEFDYFIRNDLFDYKIFDFLNRNQSYEYDLKS